MEINNEKTHKIIDEYIEEIGGFEALEDPYAFAESMDLIFEILKTDYPSDFGIFFNENGNLKSYQDLCKLKKIKFSYDPTLATRKHIHNLTEQAVKEGKIIPLIYHIVGASLQLIFTNIIIQNKSTNDNRSNSTHQGDFLIGDTVFHVTVAPMQAVFEKCKQNIANGLKVYLLIPDSKLNSARELGEQYCNGHIAVESIESFVSQNIEELSLFSTDILKSSFTRLIQLYNERVDAVEIDKSMMIELPSNMLK